MSSSIKIKILKRLRHAALRRGDDGGQALILVLVAVFLFAALGAGLVAATTQELPFVSYATSQHAAYAGLEAGEQVYRLNLNNNPDYSSVTSDPTNGVGSGVWASVEMSGAPTVPTECYHITPDANFQNAEGGGAWADGEVLAVITGRAGGASCSSSSSHWEYESAVVAFKLSSTYLQNAYYSEIEDLDPNYPPTENETYGDGDPGVTATIKTAGGATVSTFNEDEADVPVTYSYNDEAGGTIGPITTNLQQAMCQYEVYEPNTFIDSLGATNSLLGSKTFGAEYPYYGPFYGYPQNKTIDESGSEPTYVGTAFSVPSSLSPIALSNGDSETFSLITTSSPWCSTPYDFNTGETFAGPVYTQDELHVCGAPLFEGKPVSVASEVPKNFAFNYEWPGSVKGTGAFAGDWLAYGYQSDVTNSCAVTAAPSGLVETGVNETLPEFDESLQSWAEGTATTPPATPTYGCLYTGPTMIELVDTSGVETMDVWSPLSKKTSYGGASCGTFSQTTAFQTGIKIPSTANGDDGVIYVQNVPTLATDPNYWTPTALAALNSTSAVKPTDGNTPTGTTCFLNPENPDSLPTSSGTAASCTAGTLFVEGELDGQLTMGADEDVYVTRDLTYSCADGSTGTTLQTVAVGTSLPAACATEATPDLLALYANLDILISHPVSSSGTDDAKCTADGVNPTNTVADVEPTCDIDASSTAIIDAELVALKGSFGDQNWNDGVALGDAYVYGGDVADYRGPFGEVGTHGYEKEFSFDTRLSYLTPPHAVQASAEEWAAVGWVNCGGLDLANSTAPNCPNAG
jgi:hypothetical protein